MSLITTLESHSPVVRKTDDVSVAIDRAVKSAFGSTAEWFENTGITTKTFKYGQVGKPKTNGGYSMITKQICIEVNPA